MASDDQSKLRKHAQLRKHAEARLGPQAEHLSDMSPEELRDLVHELQTSQIELEMQNEELRRAQEELLESRDDEATRRAHEHLSLALQGAGAGTWDWDIQKEELVWSPELYDLFGIDATEVGASFEAWERVLHPDDLTAARTRIDRALRDGTSLSSEYRIVRGNGQVRWITALGHGTYDRGGCPVRMTGICIDITQRKRAEDALQESESRFQDLFEEDLTGNFLCTRDGRIVLCNAAFANIFGFASADAAAGTSMLELYPDPGERDSIVATLRAQRKLAYYQTWRKRRDGTLIHVAENLVGHFDDQGELYEIQGYVFDDTERKRAEEALRQQAQLLHLSYDAIIVWRKDGGIEHWNRGAEQLYGFTEREVAGRSTHKLLKTIHPAPWVEIEAAMRKHGYWEGELRHRAKDGHEVTVSARHQLVLGTDGIERVLETNRDITDRKRAEEALAAAKTAAEAANEAKSRFLANISHELRTPMNAILGMIDVALPKATDPTVLDCLETAKESADLLLALLNGLLDSAKIESGKLELEEAPFSLRRMLEQIASVLSVRANEKGLRFSYHVRDETPDAVIGDQMRLQQVLMNMGGNAVKFTARGNVQVVVRNLPDESAARLEFAVRDTGIGISPAAQERLFQPFGQADVSMARRFGGTGLGLSISKSLVEMMGGTLWVESEEGKGSTFYFTVRLPLAKELPSDFQAPNTLPATAPRQLRILLAEDNLANQKLATYILHGRGHFVETAVDGQEALDLAEQNCYDVILMDLQMPGMDGLEATAAMRQRDSSARRVPIIAMTARAMESDRQRCLAAGMDGYLSKPIDAVEMIRLIESLACKTSPITDISTGTSNAPEAVSPSDSIIFDPDAALSQCFNNVEMLRNMVAGFFEDVENLFPEMRRTVAAGDLVETGRLGHRMKGTVVYLAAQRAKQAAQAVEQFITGNGAPAEAEQAVDALERECLVLKAVLNEHPLANKVAQDQSN